MAQKPRIKIGTDYPLSTRVLPLKIRVSTGRPGYFQRVFKRMGARSTAAEVEGRSNATDTDD